jgi:hypothetical protein
VLPESALGGYVREPGPDEIAPDVPAGLAPDGPEIARLIALAGDMVICAGYSELGPGGLYASAICVSGDGVLGHQRKVHLPPAERFAYTAGDGFAAFDTPRRPARDAALLRQAVPRGGPRAGARRGRDPVSLSAWPVDRHNPARRIRDDRQTRHFDLCDRARAVENQVFVVSANQTGRWGRCASSARPRSSTPTARCSPAPPRAKGWRSRTSTPPRVERSRMVIDHLADRRPEAYGGAPDVAAALGFGG